jgi:hypothetical protein
MQVQDDARPRRPRRSQRPPTEARLQIVGVHNARAPEPHRLGYFDGAQPAAQQRRRGHASRERARATREELRRLAEVLAYEPHQVL